VVAGTSFAAKVLCRGIFFIRLRLISTKKVRAVLAITPEAKADWVRLRRAERRLDEASTLAAEGRLDAESKAKAENNLKAAADQAQTQITELKAHGEVQAAAASIHTLRAHCAPRSRVLGKRGEKRIMKHQDVQPLENHGEQCSDSVVQASNNLEADM